MFRFLKLDVEVAVWLKLNVLDLAAARLNLPCHGVTVKIVVEDLQCRRRDADVAGFAGHT